MPAWVRPLVRRVASATCGARHPEHPEYQCCAKPHTIDEDHYALVSLRDDAWITWPATEDSPARMVDVPAGEYF